MKTTRRGFVGTLVAFVAAASAPKALPSGFARAKPIREQAALMAALKECRVESIDQEMAVGSYRRLRVTYRHAPKGPRSPLDGIAEKRSAGLLPIGVMVTQQCDAIDVTRLGAPHRFEIEWPITRIEVVFA
jgi:hypothetical protein